MPVHQGDDRLKTGLFGGDPGLSAPKTIAAQVTDHLRQRIIHGWIPAGAALRQAALAKQYAVSVGVVREALVRLASEGFLEAQGRRGYRVAPLSLEEFAELHEIRLWLETQLTRDAVLQATPEQLDRAEGLVRAMDVERDVGRWLTLNNEFHATLYRSSSRRRMRRLQEVLRLLCERYHRLALKDVHRFESAQREHRALVEAFRDRDAERAVQVLQEHLLHTFQVVRSFLQAQNLCS